VSRAVDSTLGTFALGGRRTVVCNFKLWIRQGVGATTRVRRIVGGCWLREAAERHGSRKPLHPFSRNAEPRWGEAVRDSRGMSRRLGKSRIGVLPGFPSHHAVRDDGSRRSRPQAAPHRGRPGSESFRQHTVGAGAFGVGLEADRGG
jgi:hypothetical protein